MVAPKRPTGNRHVGSSYEGTYGPRQRSRGAEPGRKEAATDLASRGSDCRGAYVTSIGTPRIAVLRWHEISAGMMNIFCLTSSGALPKLFVAWTGLQRAADECLLSNRHVRLLTHAWADHEATSPPTSIVADPLRQRHKEPEGECSSKIVMVNLGELFDVRQPLLYSTAKSTLANTFLCSASQGHPRSPPERRVGWESNVMCKRRCHVMPRNEQSEPKTNARKQYERPAVTTVKLSDVVMVAASRSGMGLCKVTYLPI